MALVVGQYDRFVELLSLVMLRKGINDINPSLRARMDDIVKQVWVSRGGNVPSNGPEA